MIMPAAATVATTGHFLEESCSFGQCIALAVEIKNRGKWVHNVFVPKPRCAGGEAAPGRDAGLQEAPQPAGADRHVGALAPGC